MLANEPRTQTAQEQYAHVGNLENPDAIASIAIELLNADDGFYSACLTRDEHQLCNQLQKLLSQYPDTTRADWAALKEACLRQLGSHVASAIDHIASAMRTPAIAESALRSAGWALIEANKTAAADRAQTLFRRLIHEATTKPVEDLSVL